MGMFSFNILIIKIEKKKEHLKRDKFQLISTFNFIVTWFYV